MLRNYAVGSGSTMIRVVKSYKKIGRVQVVYWNSLHPARISVTPSNTHFFLSKVLGKDSIGSQKCQVQSEYLADYAINHNNNNKKGRVTPIAFTPPHAIVYQGSICHPQDPGLSPYILPYSLEKKHL